MYLVRGGMGIRGLGGVGGCCATFAVVLLGLPASALAGKPCADAGVPIARLAPAESRSALRCLVAERRQARGLPRMRVSAPLRRLALEHARDLVRHGHRGHRSSKGKGLADRAGRHVGTRFHARWHVGEAVAWGSSSELTTPGALMGALMASPAHRRLLDDRRFERFDVGLDGRGEDAVAVVELARLRR